MRLGTTIAIVKDNEVIVTDTNGNTSDIIRQTLEADKIGRNEVADFAKQFAAPNIVQICYNIWQWVVTHIPYIEDKDGEQCVQTPGQLYKNRATQFGGTGSGGDCKSMSVFCSAILSALGVTDYKFRFAGEVVNEELHHVYLIVRNGNEYITLDCTPVVDGLPAFNTEIAFVKKRDIKPYAASAKIGSTKGRTKIGATQEQAVGDKWAIFERDYRNNITNAVNSVRAQIAGAIRIKYYYKPLKYSLAMKFINDEGNWQNLIKAANLIIYKYWDNTNIYQADLQSANVPFPSTLQEKRKAGNDLYDDLIEFGLRPGDILSLVGLATFQSYGLSMEYFLYRAKCMVLYGQEFGISAGVPYYDSKTGAFNANGASLQDAIMIGMVFPCDGGTGRPFGEPYWCYGGYVMANGASNEQVASFSNAVPAPKTKFVNNGDGVNKDFFAQCLLKYNKWKSGNMVVIPPAKPWSIYDKYAVNGLRQYATIGTPLAPAVIIGIVTAVISAVVAIATAIAKIIASVKSTNSADASKIACPPKDFGFQFQTADGCFIGYDVNGNSGDQLVKICNGQIVEYNPDLSAPENQPGNGSFLPSTLFTPKNLLLGAGLGLAAVGLYKYSKNSNE